MTTKLSLYNGALNVIGEPPLEALDDDVPARYALDDVWDRDAINTCLNMGQWNFAMRAVRLEYEPSITPSFGPRRAFERPDDFVRVAGICSDEYYQNPLRDYMWEGGYWYADLDQIYVRYVSNDPAYGNDYSLWPPIFTRFVETWLAFQITSRATFSEKREMAKVAMEDAQKQAASNDAMEQPSPRQPTGSWVRARSANSRQNDLGNPSRLIG